MSEEIVVIGWIDYDEIEEEFEESFGGMGGFFVRGMRWKDYIENWTKEGRAYAEALRIAIIDRRLKANGSQHQNDHELVPVFNDGTFASFSFRGWGDLMAATWSEEENKDYSYMDFYC